MFEKFKAWRRERRALKRARKMEPFNIIAAAIRAAGQNAEPDTGAIRSALLALGNHGEERGTFRDLPHGAIDVLAHKLYNGQMDIAAALRSVASAIREESLTRREARRWVEAEREKFRRDKGQP